MTHAVLTRGHAWSRSSLDDGWGDVSPETAAALSEVTVERFHDLCREHGDPSVDWSPRTSQVTHEVYGRDTDEHTKWDPVHGLDCDVDELREQAIEEVWGACQGYDTPVSVRVQEILEGEDER